MRRGIGASILVAVGVGGAGWWLAHPTPLADCLTEVVAEDELSHVIDKKLADLGQRAVAAGNDELVPLDGRQYFGCRRGGAWFAFLANPEWPKEAYAILRHAPSFRYGRHWQQVKLESPTLPPEAVDASARLLAQASPIAEALAQAEQCAATSVADRQVLVEAGLPFVAAVAMGAGLANRDTAMDTAGELLDVLRSQTAPAQCASSLVMKQVGLLTAFSAGKVPGLPCRLDKDSTGPVLKCS